jgi:ketosteroid isomerase-like protein
MSQENVEVVQAALAAWNAGDEAALRELFDPEVITRPAEGWPEPGPFVGREATMRELEWLRGTWDRDTVEPVTDFVAVAERVVVRAVWHGAGHGPESAFETTQVYTLRNGKIIGVEFFWDHAEALEAVGLSG